MGQTNTFLLRRIHSLAGVIPLGVFLAEHLFTNSFALKGPGAFNQAVAVLHGLVYLPVIEFVLIWLPLTVHGIYGLWITWTARNNVGKYSYPHNWLYYLQRVSGIVALVFVAYHLYTLRISSGLFGTEISFRTVALQLVNPWVKGFYIAGLVSTIFHFAHGLSTFAITWGITVGPNSRRVMSAVSFIVFVVMLAAGIRVVVAFS